MLDHTDMESATIGSSLKSPPERGASIGPPAPEIVSFSGDDE
jgi:hypothetical protein